jgi:putative hemolysin
MSDLILQLLVVLVLVLIEAVFVAAEIALVTIRRTRVEQLIDEGHRGARTVRRLIEDPTRFLAVVQIGVTFVGFLASAYAAVNLADRLAGAFDNIPMIKEVSVGVAVIVVTSLLALFTIVIGELVPKSLALAHPDRAALMLAGPVDLLGRILAPVVSMLTWTTRKVAGALGGEVIARQAQISTEELRLIVERGGEQGVLEAEEEQMISAVIELGDRRVHEIMVPRTEMTAMPVTASMDEVIDTFIREGHSRIPVYRKTVDEVVGVLYAKDLLPFLKGGQKPDLRKLLRTPLYVPESMSIDDLLHKIQGRKVHLAIVLDEYGGTAGMVTIEDLLEEIVGEIQDEYDTEEPLTVKLSETEARIDGRASVDDLGELFDLELGDLEDADEYDTVGGLIYHRVGGVPRPGDRVELPDHGLTLTVEVTDGRRVGKVLAVRKRTPEEGAQESGANGDARGARAADGR